ncbi:MAG TPA: hypothetical protein DD706_01490, partial [Nitrospiraceae bacterium]|nr:hypothetical protein [Nitrospiraceae bacterium]
MLADERIVLVSPTTVSTCFSVLPGFAPTAEVLSDASRRARRWLWRQKDPKPSTPRLASLERADANLARADQLAPLTQGPPADESVPPLGQTAGGGLGEMHISV